MTNKELEARIKELERLAKKHDDDIVQLTKNVDWLIEEKYKEKPNHDFKVGDRVQFKSWEEMNCSSFTKSMKHLCGTYATIVNIFCDYVVTLRDFTSNGDTSFIYLLDMLKPATDEPKCKFKVGDRVKINAEYDFQLNNQIATICKICPDNVPPSYLVDFDDKKIGMVWVNEQILEPYTEPRWTFTDDEKTILRNLDVDYKWIARDRDETLCVFFTKPRKLKSVDMWDCDTDCGCLTGFNHLFKSIKWEDEEACEFRKYL